MKKLKEICIEIKDGDWIESKDQSDHGLRLIQTGNIGNRKFLDKCNKSKYISLDTFNNLKCSEIFSGDVLVSRLPSPIARACILPNINQRAITAVDCTIIRFNERICIPKYFVYYTSSHIYQRQVEKFVTGTTRQRISRKNLENIKVPIPNIKEQHKIIDILDKAQELIDKRKEQIEQLDELVKSRFIEMFSDPILNKKRWKESILENCCTKITDGTHDTPQRLSEGKLLITGKNIRRDKIDLTDIEYVSDEDHEIIYKRCNPEYGDVLYTNIGVNYGTAVINSLEYEFSMKNVALLKPDTSKITGVYLWHYLNLCRPYILEKNKAGGAQTFMSLATMKKINVLIPPMELQTQFADFINQVDKLKFEMEKSLKELEDNFNSLMQKAFKGELF